MDRPYYDPDEEPRSPALEISKPNYGSKDSPPPFLQKGSDSNTPKKPTDEGTSPDCSHPDRPDIAAFEENHPLSEYLRREDDLDLPKKYVLSKPEPHSATDESLKLAQSALNLLSDKEPSKPDEVPPPPLPLVGIGHGPDSPPKNKLVIPSLLSPDHDSHKREPDSPQCLQKSLSSYAPEAKPAGPHSPLSRQQPYLALHSDSTGTA
ncbi:hypothetical protein N8T08_011031 [Aspergillus melleus]|uniref:Uncharacterized protein n=1 Tax=Aspergillus melleus TaxID=138277 RepID=A0ACC3AQF7_9EURO|nr:hypothetical protein N8T08_011031 [Aspergillus melleus]